MNVKDYLQPVVIRMGDTAALPRSTTPGVTYSSLTGLGNFSEEDLFNDTGDYGNWTAEDVEYSTGVKVCLGCVLGLITLTTIVGNFLVCLSPLVCNKLRTSTYTFLVSLAIADLLLGITVLPFSAFNTVTNNHWIFGPVWCNIYGSFDVMFCTSSILHLLVISLERYVAITRPYAYQRNMNRKKALIALAVVWVISLLISFLPLHMGWNTDDGQVQNYDNPSHCSLQTDKFYALFDGIVLFFIPLIVMTLVYIRLVIIARRQARAIKALMVTRNENAEERANRRRSVDEHRALKIIAIVMGAFIVCWVPYFTQFTFNDVLEWNINKIVFEVFLWLGYLNSLINPVVYACMNREFRRAFQRLLTCMRWKPPDDNADSRYYTTQYSNNRSDRERSRSVPRNGVVRYSASNHQTTGNGSSNYTLQLPLKKNGIYMKLFRSSSSASSARPEPT